MNRLLNQGLFLALGCWTTHGSAQEVEFQTLHPHANSPARVVPGSPARMVHSAAPVSISRPVPLNSSPVRVTVEPEAGPGPRIVNEEPGGIRTEPLQPFAPGDSNVTEIVETKPGQKAPLFSGPQPKNVPYQPGMNQGPLNYQRISPEMGSHYSSSTGILQEPFSSAGGCGCSNTGMPMPYTGSVITGADGCTDDSCLTCAPACGSCFQECCYPRARAWVAAEYLLYSFKNQNVPPLLTRGNGPANNPDKAGALDQGLNTTVLYGGDNFKNEIRSGGRLLFGFWFPRNDCWGLDASAMYIAQRQNLFQVSSDGSAQISRPLILPGFGEGVELVSFPGLLAGQASVDYRSKLWGFDINLRRKLRCGPRFHLDGLVGFRHTQLDEDIQINENLTNLAAPFNGLRTLVEDRFSTRNNFNGGQIGLEGEFRFGRRMFVQGQVKVAAGNMYQRLTISGNTTFINNSPTDIVPPSGNLPVGASVSYPVGILAAQSNIGTYNRNTFAVVPEVGLKVGVDLTDHLRLYVGYDFLYISDVIRPGDNIDRTLDVAQIPNVGGPLPAAATRPAVLFKTTDFWAQGFKAGLEYQW